MTCESSRRWVEVGFVVLEPGERTATVRVQQRAGRLRRCSLERLRRTGHRRRRLDDVTGELAEEAPPSEVHFLHAHLGHRRWRRWRGRRRWRPGPRTLVDGISQLPGPPLTVDVSTG